MNFNHFCDGTNPGKYKHSLIMILNYLDTIAIGIDQKIYDENLARDHTEAIVKHYSERYLTEAAAKDVGFSLNDYRGVCELAKNWSTPRRYYGRDKRWRLT